MTSLLAKHGYTRYDVENAGMLIRSNIYIYIRYNIYILETPAQFLAPVFTSILKTISILPRQARDTHRKS